MDDTTTSPRPPAANKSPNDIYNLDSERFDPDAYIQKVLKDCSLKQVMDTEAEIVRDTQTLHSDMQTLVYENYNKFISATDAIRQMKTDFKQMETEMSALVTQMASINAFSTGISATLHGTSSQLGKLSEKHALLQKLQFLSSLPATLKALRSDRNYRQAVADYRSAQTVLLQYGSQPSFRGIQTDCVRIMADIRDELRDQFRTSTADAVRLRETGALLLQLDERPAELAADMLASSTTRLHQQIVALQDQTERDVLRFIELSIDGFLNDLSLMVGSYAEMFYAPNALERENDDFAERAAVDLRAFVTKKMDEYLALVQERVDIETGRGDSGGLLKALDRLHRRLVAMRALQCDVDFAASGLEIIVNTAKQLCNFHLRSLREFFADSISAVRLGLATAPQPGKSDAPTSGHPTTTVPPNLDELVASLYQSTVEKVRGVLQDMLIFVQPELSFQLRRDPRGTVCIEGIREQLLVGFLRQAAVQMRQIAVDGRPACGPSVSPPASLHLVLAKCCLEFERSGVRSLLGQADSLYAIDDAHALTSDALLSGEMRTAAQQLLDTYVRVQGVRLSLVLRKSVETRDWLNCLEPRSVRAVMKRFVDELTAVEAEVADLFESGSRTAASSDSSRRTLGGGGALMTAASKQQSQYRSTWSTYTNETSFASNVHRLFCERVDLFSSVDFSKVAIVTGVVKVSLKTLLECVRLRTYSRFGLQQIQVDAHYLQMNLWRFVSDENLVHFLLDEILGSAVHRCLEPNLMEPNAVEIICERG